MVRYVCNILATVLLVLLPVGARATTRASDYVSANTYNNLYPYMNNTMRVQLNPGTDPATSNAPINILTRTKSTGTSTRNVVARTPNATNTGRAATTANMARSASSASTARGVVARSGTTGTARAATTNTTRGTASSSQSGRRVVARSGTTGNTSYTARANRNDSANTVVRNTGEPTYVYGIGDSAVSSTRCLADYADCMDDYCSRPEMEYDRCYCSAKLAQIEAQYKPEIDRLIKEILTLQNGNYWTDAEMNEYWMETIGQYTGSNAWADLDAALDIDWSDTTSTVRGQQSFAMGHAYCSQHLKNCAYMRTNLRDAYRSEIARDCAAYETSLQTLKNVAESLVETYK